MSLLLKASNLIQPRTRRDQGTAVSVGWLCHPWNHPWDPRPSGDHSALGCPQQFKLTFEEIPEISSSSLHFSPESLWDLFTFLWNSKTHLWRLRWVPIFIWTCLIPVAVAPGTNSWWQPPLSFSFPSYQSTVEQLRTSFRFLVHPEHLFCARCPLRIMRNRKFYVS